MVKKLVLLFYSFSRLRLWCRILKNPGSGSGAEKKMQNHITAKKLFIQMMAVKVGTVFATTWLLIICNNCF